MIEQCLQKAPEARFASGAAIQEFLTLHSVLPKKGIATGNGAGNVLQHENEQLRRDKADLQKALAQQTQIAAGKERELANLRVALTRKEREWAAKAPQQPAFAPPPPPVKNTKDRSLKLPVILAIIFVVGSILYLAATNLFGSNDTARQKEETPIEKKQEPVALPREVIGEYKVVADRAYFHNQPDEATRRSAYMVPSEDVIKALEEKAGFIYAEFTNSRGQTSKGWLKKEDMMPLQEWLTQQNSQQVPLSQSEIDQQLEEARNYVAQRNIAAAFAIYQKLSDEDVPEAMFEYGNRALKGEHDRLDCDAAYALVQKASERDYTPAKRTLGFLYLFGQNKEVLRMSKYNKCTYERNIVKGTRLLMQAISQGDSTANDILTDFNKGEGNETDSIQ
jgi:serine/threonine-protein kinase